MEPSDLGLLVTLDALLQEGSVTRAARRVGLSTPAMSHALARIRKRLGDPVLVRSGRGMLLSPRAEELRARVHAVVADARAALEPVRPFVANELDRTFVVRVTDYVVTVLGIEVDRILREEAPDVSMKFVPNSPDDAELLRGGHSDLAVGIYGELPQEMRSRRLLTDRFVCAVRADHPTASKRLSLDQFLSLPHLQVAPRGQSGGYLDDVLKARGLARRVARAVPFFVAALQMTARTDYVVVISERIANRLAPTLGLVIHEVPVPLRPYALNLVWHPRVDKDPAHRFLREAFVRAATAAAGDLHPGPRTRLDTSDETSGQRRRRPRRAGLHGMKR
ncbi:MAG: LysR family transcriptional regulator [Myxococcales bacterium]|nr:LysR family transcriptional regulator [Myxococcales bacterium]